MCTDQESGAEVVSGLVVLIEYQTVGAITGAITVALLKDKGVKINGFRASFLRFICGSDQWIQG